MLMNIHPVFVHFPVALLSVYALMELVPFKKITGRPYWFYFKAVFVCVGGLGALAAWLTGKMAAQPIRHDAYLRPILRMHENFAQASIAVFGIIAASYLVLWLDRENFSSVLKSPPLSRLWQWLKKLAQFFAETKLVILLAVAGLICITVTGALGGDLVYGQNVDPVVKLVHSILIGN